MKNNIILLASLFLSTSAFALNDGFNFTECAGSGTFKQQIQHYGGDYENTITVGTIPIGIKGLNIELRSDNDVDIRLYGQENDKIVHWPHGLLSHATEESTPYQNTEITYSGYNGVDGNKGYEYINVSGTTQVPMTMKAFGYQAGFATVNYSWSGKEGCDNSGDGNFTQSITKDALTLVGEIPAGIPNVEIILMSENDLDIQLYDADGIVIVGWKPVGILSGSGIDSLEYHGMNIEWSGYNGTNGNKGHEYIKITGNTTEVLTMKVYGYEAGLAEVTYSWSEDNATSTPTPQPCISPEELQNKVISGDDITDVNTSCITDMSGLFSNADEFNQDISGWDVSNVTNMSFMFSGASIFNQPIGNWDVSQVTTMNDMFAHAEKFNQPIGDWNVSKVNNMNGLFWEAKSFNQPLNNWDVSNVTYMPLMFLDAQSFNQPLNNWNVSKVDNMWRMFMNTSAFNQDIHLWNTCNASSNHSEFSINSALSIQNRPQFVCY